MKCILTLSLAALTAAAPAFHHTRPIVPRGVPADNIPVERDVDPALDVDIFKRDVDNALKRDADPSLDVDIFKRDVDNVNAAKRNTEGRQDSTTSALTKEVSAILTQACDSVDGTMITETVCETFPGSDITVEGLKGDGNTAKVTVSGKGLLEGSSITVPVGSLQDVLAKFM